MSKPLRAPYSWTHIVLIVNTVSDYTYNVHASVGIQFVK